MQAPVTVNAATIREFRLLIDDLMGRAEKLRATGSTWSATNACCATASSCCGLTTCGSTWIGMGTFKLFFSMADIRSTTPILSARRPGPMRTFRRNGSADWSCSRCCKEAKESME